MIRRIILFLGLLLIAFFVYRRYNQAGADQLLYKIKTLSFKKSTNTYTTTVDGKVISPDTIDKIVTTATLSGSDTITQNIATITQMTNDAMNVSSGENTSMTASDIATMLIKQAYENSISMTQINSGSKSNPSPNDILIDEIIGRVIETSSGYNQTGIMIVNTENTNTSPSVQTIIETAKANIVQQSSSVKNTTTSSISLSSQDKEEASDFLGAFSQD